MIYVGLPLALLLAAAAVVVFIWATRSGQFDDLETPAVRVLFDEEQSAPCQGTHQPNHATGDPRIQPDKKR